jgi:predicted dehydrogenase
MISLHTPVWLIGAGGMAVDYVKVLKELEVPVVVIGRSGTTCKTFFDKTGLSAYLGGLEVFLATAPQVPETAIVAVGVEGLAGAAMQLLRAGVRRVLLEKPGALYYSELQALHEMATSVNAEVAIAYNRRMYASVLAAQKMIEEDGGIQSMNFEFTEWGHVIEGVTKAPGVKEAWLLGNSSHVIDLAFYLGGSPVELHTQTSGSLPWHPSSAVFAGAGRTDRGVLFSYQANWDAPGRWGAEFLTRQRRLIFRPMESLHVMRRGSILIEAMAIDDGNEKNFKPGLYRQVVNFLSKDKGGSLCSLSEQLIKWRIYENIAGYTCHSDTV